MFELMEKTNEKGHAIIEMAIILPLLILLTLGSLEFQIARKTTEIAVVLSREAANTALRECSSYSNNDEDTSAPDGLELQSCLARVAQEMENESAIIAPNAKVIITLWASNPSTRTTKANEDSDHQSRFSTAEVLEQYNNPDTHPNTLGALLALHGQLVVGEVYIPYTPIIMNISNLFSNNLRELYASTIM